ncbi:hypothetical protein AC1031_012508 [Aphanomyces cochlioides]|nr:hypothetical protein AC1031_012508 [Aphanomyces cochlioides]
MKYGLPLLAISPLWISLTALIVSHALVTDAFVLSITPILQSMEKLSSLSFAYCIKLTKVIIESLSLQELDVTACSDLAQLRLQCPVLSSLDCSWCRHIHVKNVIVGTSAPKLSQLALRGWDPSGGSLDTQLGLLLRSFPLVCSLNLSHVALSDRGLFSVFVLANSLETLVLSQPQSNVWVDGTWTLDLLTMWKARRPNVHVVLQ